MVFSPYLTSELVINSNAEVKKNLKLFFEKTKIIPAKSRRQKNNDYILFKPHRHLMKKAGITFQKIQSYSKCGDNYLHKFFSILNMAVDFGRFHFPVLT